MNEYKWENQDEWIEYITSNLESSLHREKMEQRIKKIHKIKSKING